MRARHRFEAELSDLDLREYDVGSTATAIKGLPPRCGQTSPWQDVACPASKPSGEIQAYRISWLKHVIRRGILTRKPHGQSEIGGSRFLFAGSWDWHSAVHAHWALLSMARVTKDAELETELMNRMSPKAIKEERDYLIRHKGFELPYGRSWLLLTLSELAKRPSRAKEIEKFQLEMQESVLEWLGYTAFPESGHKTGGTFEASYQSWLFSYFLVVLSQPKTKSVLDRLAKFRKEKLEPRRADVIGVVHTAADFLYLPAVLAAVDRIDSATQGHPAAYSQRVEPSLADPPLNDANAHSAGAALVRVWPYAIDSQKGDAKACARFNTRMNEIFSRMDQWADSFELVAHWVPQFMWMALWLEMGRNY